MNAVRRGGLTVVAPHLLIAALPLGIVGAPRVAHLPDTVLLVVGCAATILAPLATGAGRAGLALALLGGGLTLVGLGWGIGRIEATRPALVRAPVAVDADLVVDTAPAATAGGWRVRARLRRARDARGSPVGSRVMLELPRAAPVPGVGTVVRARGMLLPPAGGEAPAWWRRYLDRQLISGRLRARSLETVGRRGGLSGRRDQLRNALGASAGRGLRGDTRAIVRGMALGGGTGLDPATAERMRRAGIWHILAVSGQNVGFVSLSVLAVLTALGVGRRLGALTAILAIVLYCLACDGGASVARAGIVGGLVLASQVIARARDRWYLTLVGLTVLLVVQPRSIGDPGLQLSFSAVVGLMALTEPLRTWTEGFMPARLAGIVAQSVAASVATAPVAIAHFGAVSLIGILANVVVVPLAGPVVVLALLGAVTGLVSNPLGLGPTLLAGVGAKAIEQVAVVAAAVPHAMVTPSSPGVVIALALALAIPALGWWLWRADPWRDARAVGPAGVWVPLAAGCIVVVWATRPEPPWPRVPTLTVLDVGQGDAILVRSPDGAAALVDTGPPRMRDSAITGLARLGVRRLDALVVTHDQADHAGAAKDILGAVRVRAVVAPRAGDVAGRLASRTGRAVTGVAAGDRLAVGSWGLRVLWPPASLRFDDPNGGSLVMLAEAEGLRVLLCADAEGHILRRLAIGPVDAIKVAHHGSDDPELGEVLRRARPRVAAISVGQGNTFGHPSQTTLTALAAHGVATWRTDRDGTITVTPGRESPGVRSDR